MDKEEMIERILEKTKEEVNKGQLEKGEYYLHCPACNTILLFKINPKTREWESLTILPVDEETKKTYKVKID
jgi:hypothetical protein